ncbi:hypothetical protein WJX81_003095 [Elliptochloris bilobata]|uniref:dolichyl-phosphate-mannose--protein mannosyltransferase n=1 Tax=Elliptochloris bilobata TaxID=381761 RepID=A0AAW1RC11_9CHLO
MHYSQVPARAIYAVLVALTCGAYLNTLFASFAFDDNFAVITNGDVTDDNKPLSVLFKNDFWGTRIWNDQSHKSYRPLTVLAFRFQRKFGARVFDRLGWRREDVGQWRGVNPIPFHASNILLHALVTCLVFKLAVRMCATRDCAEPGHSGSAWSNGVPNPAARHAGSPERDTGRPHAASAAGGGSLRLRRPGTGGSAAAQRDVGQNLPADPAKATDQSVEARRAEAALAAALFALHPVHTEAVAGVVGQAELLSAALSLAALLLYARAAQPRERTVLAHWLLVGTSLLLVWAAALTKEIGITTVGAMALYDALLLPWPPLQPRMPGRATPVSSRRLQGRPHVQSPELRRWAAALWALARSRKVARLAAGAGAVGCYVALRSLLAVDQLVRTFRKVENPIPFVGPTAARLTTGYLHARYMGLLLAPVQLSADWSFACIPPLEALADPRNLATAALYAWLLWVLLSARPWQVVMQRARWRLVVAAGLVVAPFFPAANVLFPVGTFIGERLLYAPSIGFCLLAADALARLAGPHLPRLMLLWAPGDAGSAVEEPEGQRLPMRARAAAALTAALLAAYAARTFARNLDWETEEALFRSAEKVCPDSAKVRLNMGILERRYGRWAESLRHFERARMIEPGFCEPVYWHGLTLVNHGTQAEVLRGVQELQEALDCKWVAREAAEALQAVYQALHSEGPQGGAYLRAWADVLLRPGVMKIEAGCLALEQAAIGMPGDPVPDDLQGLLQPCLEHLPQPPAPLHAQPDTVAQAVSACLHARMALLRSLKRHAPDSTQAKEAVYEYIGRMGGRCMWQQTPSADDTVYAADRGLMAPAVGSNHEAATPHMQLLHRFQRADALDGWLQRAWADALAAAGRIEEAAKHFEAAGAMLSELLRTDIGFAPVLGVTADGSAGLVGAPRVAAAALEACELSLKAGAEDGCRVRYAACSTHAALAQLLAAAAPGSAQATATMRAGRACLRALEAVPECGRHVAAAAAAAAMA